MWEDVLTKPMQGTALKEVRYMLVNFPVEYVDSCTKDVDKIAGFSKSDLFPITSCSTNPLENKVCSMDSPQECVGGVSKY